MKRLKSILFLLILISVEACGQQLDSEAEKDIEKVVEYFNNQDFEKALEFADKLIKRDSSDYVSWTLKGRSLFNLGKEQEGMAAINKAIEINPKYNKAYGFRAVMYHMIGASDLKQAIDDINIALQDDPKNIQLIKIKAGFLYNAGQFEEALNEYNKLLKFDPENYSATVFRASAHRKMGNFDLALDGYDKAIKINSDESFAFEERAFLFLGQEDFQKAIEDYDRIIKLIPDNHPELAPIKAYTYNNRGFAYHKAGDNQKALSDINHSLQLLPTNSYAYKNRALVYLEISETERGCTDLQRAIEFGYTQRYGNEVENLIKSNCNKNIK